MTIANKSKTQIAIDKLRFQMQAARAVRANQAMAKSMENKT